MKTLQLFISLGLLIFSGATFSQQYNSNYTPQYNPYSTLYTLYGWNDIGGGSIAKYDRTLNPTTLTVGTPTMVGYLDKAHTIPYITYVYTNYSLTSSPNTSVKTVSTQTNSLYVNSQTAARPLTDSEMKKAATCKSSKSCVDK